MCVMPISGMPISGMPISGILSEWVYKTVASYSCKIQTLSHMTQVKVEIYSNGKVRGLLKLVVSTTNV